MRFKRAVFPVLLLGVAVVGQGCSSRAWYQGMRERQRIECYKLSDPQAVGACLDRVDSLTYDTYRRLRKERFKEAR